MENTLIVFSSDNGPWLVMEDHGGSAGILREGKQYTFEGGVRVPTVAMWQGTIPAGTVYEDMACQMDWFPTIANLTGIPVPDDREYDGVDITNVLLNQGKRDGDSYLFFDLAELECYRHGDWKVKRPFKGFAGAIWKKAVGPHDTLLVNLKEDPGEQNNLHAKYPEKSRALFAEMEKAYKDLGELPPSLFIRSNADKSHYEYIENKRKKK